MFELILAFLFALRQTSIHQQLKAARQVRDSFRQVVRMGFLWSSKMKMLKYGAQSSSTWMPKDKSLKIRSVFSVVRSKTLRSHLETVIPVIAHNKRMAKNPQLAIFHRVMLRLQDGEFIALDFGRSPEIDGLPEDAPILLLLHGLSGSSCSQYMLSTQHKAHRRGWRTISMNGRGTVTPLATPKTYCAFCDDDVVEVIDYIKQRFPESPVGLCGWSMGGSIALRYLRNPDPVVVAAVATSVPLDMMKTLERLDKGLNRNYRDGMLKPAKAAMMDSITMGDTIDWAAAGIDINDIEKSQSAADFTRKCVAPAFGHKDTFDEFVSQQTLSTFRHELVRTPLLIINAMNDPLLKKKDFDAFSGLPGNVQTLIYPSGGHLGFWSGWPPTNVSIKALMTFMEYWIDGANDEVDGQAGSGDDSTVNVV